MKQAISVLDKVAYFIYDYCNLSTPKSDRVSFRQLWGGNDIMREDLRHYENPYLYALFTLSRDVSKSGDWKHIYEHRDALTHRFLVLHDLSLGQEDVNQDIPREMVDDFIKDTLRATKIARNAVMYLILFVALEEEKLMNDNDSPFTPTMDATMMDDDFRHRPPFHE